MTNLSHFNSHSLTQTNLRTCHEAWLRVMPCVQIDSCVGDEWDGLICHQIFNKLICHHDTKFPPPPPLLLRSLFSVLEDFRRWHCIVFNVFENISCVSFFFLSCHLLPLKWSLPLLKFTFTNHSYPKTPDWGYFPKPKQHQIDTYYWKCIILD